MSYFSNCKTLDELKATYKRLALKYHPDCGGDVRIMQEVNAEYETTFESLKRCHNVAQKQAGKPETDETADEFKDIIEQLINLAGLDVELCGSWLWIGGNTKPHKEALKAAGCRWSRSKTKWYWHHKDAGAKWSRGHYSMEKIREKYGSQVLTNSTPNSLTA